MRRKIVKGAAEFTGMALALAGLVVCMCETAELDRQLATMGIGLGMIAAGAVVCILANWGEDDGMS